jgi:hypothetical protein
VNNSSKVFDGIVLTHLPQVETATVGDMSVLILVVFVIVKKDDGRLKLDREGKRWCKSDSRSGQ